MFKWLLPKETSFFDFFEKHIGITIEAAHELLSITKDPLHVSSKALHIKELERKADDVLRQCTDALHKTFITPFERDDIFQLIFHLDDIIDYIEEAASRYPLYKIETANSQAIDLTQVLLNQTLEIESALKGLRHSKKIELMKQFFTTIDHLENEGDHIIRNAIGKLFTEEQDAKTIIKWKEIYENIESGIDSCEIVSNIIEGVILERD